MPKGDSLPVCSFSLPPTVARLSSFPQGTSTQCVWSIFPTKRERHTTKTVKSRHDKTLQNTYSSWTAQEKPTKNIKTCGRQWLVSVFFWNRAPNPWMTLWRASVGFAPMFQQIVDLKTPPWQRKVIFISFPMQEELDLDTGKSKWMEHKLKNPGFSRSRSTKLCFKITSLGIYIYIMQ